MKFSFCFLVCCFSVSVGFTQHYKENVDNVLRSALPVTQKIDSLYNVGFENYPSDYVFFKSVADILLRMADSSGNLAGKGKAYILQALVAEGQGDLQATGSYAREAVEVFSAMPLSKELSLALYCQGSYFRRKKRDKEAIETFLRCLEVAEQLRDARMVATAYTSLGIINVSQGNYGKALDYYQKTLDIAIADGNKGREQRTYTNMGIVYMRLHQYEQSIQSHLKALHLAQELGVKRDEAFVYNDLGAVYLNSDLGISKAIDYLSKSITLREQLGEKSEIPYTYNYLGQAYAKMDNRPEAERWIKKALETAMETGNHKQQYEALDELATLYNRFKQYDSAYTYLRQHNILRDSIRLAEQSEAIAGLTIQYETQKKEQEIALLTQQNTIQRLDIRQRNLYLSIAVMLCAGALLVVWQVYRMRKRKEQQLKKEAALQAELLQLEARHALQNDRLRISRDLHDNIGANLTFIHSAVADAGSKPVQHQQWQDVQNMVYHTIGELRRTVWLINKPAVSFEEWLVKLREYFRKVSKVVIEANEYSAERALSSIKATALFRITQESVNNSLKHGNAEQISIALRTDETAIFMTISDNGTGFDPDNADRGFGLDNMQQQAAAVNGTVFLESSPEQGTTVKAIVPW